MSVDEKNEKPLTYFISEKPPFAAVIFIGEMTGATVEVLEACEKDLAGHTSTLYVIALRDVNTVEIQALGPLIRMQKLLRERGALRICSIKPDIRNVLVEKGAVRDAECCNNLAEAIESLKSAQAKKATG